MRSYPLLIVAMLTCLGVSTPAHAQAPIPGQPYQIPAGFEGYGPGTLISYGGNNYVTQGDGTMLLQLTGYSGPAAAEEGPAPDQPYQIPADFAGLAAGSLVSYGGSGYVIQSDGTMLLQPSADPGADPSTGQPGYSYSSYYAQPGDAGYGGDPGGASYGSTDFQLGIGIYGRPGYPSQPVGHPTHPTHPMGGQGYHPGGQGYHPGGQGYHPGGQGYHPGGQGYHPGGQGYHPSAGARHPAGGGSGGGRAVARRR